MSQFPEDLKYTAEHEWVRQGNEGNIRVGVTDYATEQLGDIVYVDLPSVGDEVTGDEPCGELESTKSVSELYSPIAGSITGVNDQLGERPEMVNSDPYGDGWLFEIAAGEDTDLNALMDADAYAAHVENPS